MILKNKNIGLSLLITCIVLLGSLQNSSAQSSSRIFSDLSVKNKVALTIYGVHHFDNEAKGFFASKFNTEREGSKGLVNFGRGSSWIGVSDRAHVDGYVCVYHNNSFTFPIGSNLKYRPVAISGARVADAAYFDEDPLVISDNNLHSDLEEISDREYWDVNGDKFSKLTLTWDDESNIKELTNDELKKLSLVGWIDGTWVVIPSTVDEFMLDINKHDASYTKDLSKVTIGSITTDEPIVLNQYDYYTLGSVKTDLIPDLAGVEFNIFPNPHVIGAISQLKFTTANDRSKTIRVFNSKKELVYENQIGASETGVSLQDVTEIPGVYTIQVADINGAVRTKNLIIVDN